MVGEEGRKQRMMRKSTNRLLQHPQLCSEQNAPASPMFLHKQNKCDANS